uniref:Uncharacterized protein n=1 Tax=Gouania willdenowi TaxID=441366 RepID=A0A8C5GFG7_GOUWI
MESVGSVSHWSMRPGPSVMRTHSTQEELKNVQNMVSHTERTLKVVSDCLDKHEKFSLEAIKNPPKMNIKSGKLLVNKCVDQNKVQKLSLLHDISQKKATFNTAGPKENMII